MTSDDDYDFTSTGGNYYQPSRWRAPKPLELPAVDWQSRWREEKARAEKAEAERDKDAGRAAVVAMFAARPPIPRATWDAMVERGCASFWEDAWSNDVWWTDDLRRQYKSRLDTALRAALCDPVVEGDAP